MLQLVKYKPKHSTVSSNHWFFGRPFVKRFALCYRTVVLSVTLVYCGQTVRRIKMKPGMQVGLIPAHILY